MMPALFAADVAFTGMAAWLLACAGGHSGRGFLEGALAWLWSVTALVAAAGIGLGVTGGLGPAGFLCVHAAILSVLALFRRRTLRADLSALRTACAQARDFLNAPGAESLLALALFLILAALTVIDMWAQPEVLDALTYHLPRVGHWLQDGEVRMMATPDARANFIASLPEVVMAWFVGRPARGTERRSSPRRWAASWPWARPSGWPARRGLDGARPSWRRDSSWAWPSSPSSSRRRRRTC